MKHVQNILQFFGALEHYSWILDDKDCQDFFVKMFCLLSSAALIQLFSDHLQDDGESESVSFLTVDHDKLESDGFLENFRNNRRKFLSNIHGNVKIDSNKYIAIAEYKERSKCN